jgi:hypothetical protein
MNINNGFAFLIMLFCLLFGSLLISGCKAKTETSYQMTGDTIKDGKNLVNVYCTKCHALVPVNALTKDVWTFHTLPSMAHYFSIRAYMDGYFKDDTATSGLSLSQYQAIVSYYKKLAPVSLPVATPPVPLINDWAGFKLKAPAPVANYVYSTMAAIDPYSHKIYTSDYKQYNITEWDMNLKPVASKVIASSAVNGFFGKNEKGDNSVLLSCIGRIDPSDFRNGKVLNLNGDLKSNMANPTIASELDRPVQTIEGDFNKDGLNDLVIVEQGHLKGGIMLLTQKTDRSYTSSLISVQPGAVQAVTGDFNGDGYADLMVLFGSGDEGLWLYLNDHKGGFTARNLLRFPPVYGSTSFQLTDMDHDGKPDLIYTCGYNFHDSRILKPYHGLYIFKNMGNWNFKQQYFYPINGCTKAIVADFDGDGDLDIATSAFFADMQNNPAESFIYFEQGGPFSFKPHAIPISKYGRWMSMDVGDYNNDGKPDIVLANYSTGFLFQPGLKPFWLKNIPFVVLENNFKKE